MPVSVFVDIPHIIMNLRKTKLYKTISSGSPDAVMKSLWDYLKSGKDVNIRDEESGGTLLHLLVDYGERFCEPDTIQAIYMMVCKDIDIDARDTDGETALHKVMRKKGTYRIMMAIIRFVVWFHRGDHHTHFYSILVLCF